LCLYDGACECFNEQEKKRPIPEEVNFVDNTNYLGFWRRCPKHFFLYSISSYFHGVQSYF
jgi:hypothetical protein